MISMKDISIACGVSVATVSKALNNHKDIGEETKKRIRRVAKEMGYIPNSASKALKTRRTYNIGVLFVYETHSGLTHDYFSYVLASFKNTAEQRGYDITFINNCRTRPNKMSYLEHARYRGFDGVVLADIDFHDSEVLELMWSDIPMVTIDYLFHNRMAVLSDNIKGMKDLFTFVYNKGHRRIAYIHGEDVAVTQNRIASFYKTAQELGVTVPEEYVKKSIYRNTNAAYASTMELLDLPNPPTCILYSDDFASYGGINAIKERGMSIPRDISIAGYDGIRIGRHIEPQLTTLRQDTETIGAQAAESLIELIENPRTTLIKTTVVEGKLIEGKTVGEIKV